MFEELNTIELSGTRYPIKCDLLVLEQIQNEFDDIQEFEKGIMTHEKLKDDAGEDILDDKGHPKAVVKLPQAKAVNCALYWMAKEGEAITAKEENREVKTIDREELIRSVDLSLFDLADQLHLEFYRCFSSKNGKATQSQAKKG